MPEKTSRQEILKYDSTNILLIYQWKFLRSHFAIILTHANSL